MRAQLRERLGALELPEGTDPADAERLRRDLDGLLDRYRAAPGQSVDEAVATLRYEFEDRMRDFAQDQRIDALIEQARTDGREAADEPSPEAVEDVTDDIAATGSASTDDEATDDGPVVTDVFDEVAEDVAGADDTPPDVDNDHSVADVAEEPTERVRDESPAASEVDDVEEDDDLGDDVLGTGAMDPPTETDPLILTAPGVGVPDATADDVGPDGGRLTKDLIPEVVGESADPVPVDDDATFHTAIVPGGEFLDPADVEPAPEPVATEAPTDDDPLDSPLGV